MDDPVTTTARICAARAAGLRKTTACSVIMPVTDASKPKHAKALATKHKYRMDGSIRAFMDIIENLRVSEKADEDSALKEDGRIVKGVNTTVDVDTDQTAKEAAKFGNSVDSGGVPPLIREDSEDSPVPGDDKPELEPRYKTLFSLKSGKK